MSKGIDKYGFITYLCILIYVTIYIYGLESMLVLKEMNIFIKLSTFHSAEMKKFIAILFLLFTFSFASFAQNANLIINNSSAATGIFINITGGTAANPAYLIINNASALAGDISLRNAITPPVTGATKMGWIISEGQYNCVEWMNTAASVSYVVPFGYSNTDYIPFTYARTAAAGASTLTASTYYNSNGNMQSSVGLPAATDGGAVPAVGNINLAFNSSATNGYQNIIDRFWLIQASKPAVLSFTYRGASENNMASPNSNIYIQHWNATGCWDDGNSGTCSTTTAYYMTTGTAGINLSSDYTVTGTASCSEFSPYILSSASNPLPIELLSFTATCINAGVSINWQTASETNNNYFTIESSIDGETWKTVTTVPGAGNSNTLLSYSYNDNSAYSGSAYYRLIQTDYNGQSKTYDPVVVNCSDINSGNNGITLIYPNPADDEVAVEISCLENSNGRLTIYNTIGQKIIEQQLELLKGRNVYTINISGLAVGIYPVTFNNGQGESSTRKIIKSK